MASSAGLGPLPRIGTYAATKAFLASFAESLHAELQGTGVSVTTLNPGPVHHRDLGARRRSARLRGSGPSPMWEDAATVARAGLRALEAGDRVATPGSGGLAVSWAGRWLPRGATLRLNAAVGGDRGARWLAGRHGWTLRRRPTRP